MRTPPTRGLFGGIVARLTLVVAVLAGAACSGSTDDSTAAPTPTDPTEQPEPTPSQTAVPSPTPRPTGTPTPSATPTPGLDSFPETDALVDVTLEPAPDLFCSGHVGGTAESPGNRPEIQTLGAEIARYSAAFEDGGFLPWTGYVVHLDQPVPPHAADIEDVEVAVTTWSDADGRTLVTTLLLRENPDVEQWILTTAAWCPTLLDPLRNEDGTFDVTQP